jgi:para-nitrobenzyl esterase
MLTIGDDANSLGPPLGAMIMRIRLSTMLLMLGFVWPASSWAATGPTVTVESGRLAGEANGSISTFKGIPYAAAPVGELRWRAPKSPARWHGVRPAISFGAACVQDPALGGNPQPQSEDCLFLNVWTPADAPHASLPVMVWIHGGGFVAGAGFQNLYDGANFARDGVVLVSINYRLNAMGFFSHPGLAGGGNFGLMDEIAALQWVRKNIAAFGGDPRRVTVFGESAGGDSVLFLLTAAIPDLFAQAIIESGPGYRKPKTQAAQQAHDIKLAEAAGVSATGGAKQLRALAPQKFFGDFYGAGPFIDGNLVRQFPLAVFQEGKARRVPLIIGSNSDEGSIAKIYSQAVPEILSAMGDQAARVREAYGEAASDEAIFGRQLFGDVVFGAASRRIAALNSASAPTFLYQFDYLTADLRGKRPGAAHVSEVPYVFDTLTHWWAPPTDEDKAMATLVHSCWVSFAKLGHPVCAQPDSWSPYDPHTDRTFLITREGTHQQAHYRAGQYDAIAAALYYTANLGRR